MNSELQDALELAQEYNCLVTESTNSSLVIFFDNERIAAAYTRRVNQATQTLVATKDGLRVAVAENS